MVDMVQVARRRKLRAAQAVGDVQRIGILRGMMTAETPEEVGVPKEAPAAPVEEIVEPEEVPADEEEVEVPEDEEVEVPEEVPAAPVEEIVEPPSDEDEEDK